MPRPVLQAMVLADNVYRDGRTNKHIISGTFSQIFTKKLTSTVPVEHVGVEPEGMRHFTEPLLQMGNPYVYLALVEVTGRLDLTLKYVKLSDSSVLFDVNFSINNEDPLRIAEFIIPVPVLPTSKGPGAYSLDLVFDGEILGSWRVSVFELDQPPESGEAQ